MSRINFSRAFAVCAVSLCASLLSISANAASAQAAASVFDLTDSAGVLTFSGATYLVDASTPISSGFDVGTSPASYFFNDTTGLGTSVAAATAHGALDLPETSAGVNTQGRGSATVQWSLDWTASADGNAAVNLEYLSSYTVANLVAGETASASSFISLLVDGTQYQSEVLNFYSNVNGNNFADSFLSLVFPVLAGQHGSLTITLASNAIAAPVPLPAAIWLLGSALLGLGSVSRRRR